MSQLRKKGHFAKVCTFEHQKRQEIKEITEPQETEENDTDKSINLITEIKHLTDRRNHITMTIKNDGTEKKIIIDTGSPVTIIPPEKEIMKNRKILPVTKKYQDLNRNEVIFTGKITVEAESKGIRKTETPFRP